MKKDIRWEWKNSSLGIDRYLLRDDSVWITRLSRDFWWNLERISEMTITRENPISTCKIVGQRSTHIPEKFDLNSDFEYNPFQSKFSLNANIWTNHFQQVIPWS